MSNIKSKNRVEHYENPKLVFDEKGLNECEFVIKSNNNDVVIFAKDKKFFEKRKSYIKKLLLSKEKFNTFKMKKKKKKDIDKQADKAVKETMARIVEENAKLRESCESVTSIISNHNNTVTKLNNLLGTITFNTNQYYIVDTNKLSFLSDGYPGCYFIQQIDDIPFDDGLHELFIFKIPDKDGKVTIYNTICQGSFIVKRVDDSDMFKLVNYSLYYYGRTYHNIASTMWGYNRAFSSLLNERPMIILDENTIISKHENMPVYNINDSDVNDTISKNILSIVSNKRVEDILSKIIPLYGED